MKAIAWITMLTSLASLGILLVISAKAQNAQDYVQQQTASFTSNPFNYLLSLVRGNPSTQKGA